MDNQEKIKEKLILTLHKYEGEVINNVLYEIVTELNDVLNQHLSEHYVIKEDFPIEFENELGRWKINSDGTTYVPPKTETKYIECNITIKPTGEVEND